MAMHEPPVIIVGAGLAGTACAIRLAQLGHRVILIEKSVFPRRKLCGEFLGPDAMPILDRLEVLNTVRSASNGPVEKLYLHNTAGKKLLIQTRWIRKDYPYALALPRMVLDNLLLNQAKKLGVEVYEETKVDCCEQQANGQFKVLLHPSTSPHSVQTLYASYVVDASGRNSRLSSLNQRQSVDTSQNIPVEKSIGLQCHVKLHNSSNDLLMFFFEGGYGGIQPISGSISNLCFWIFPRLTQKIPRDIHHLLAITMRKNPAAQELLRDIDPIEPIATVSGLRKLHHISASRELISVGDSQLSVEPFSGFGMSHALKTGYLAAETINNGSRLGQNYSKSREQYVKAYKQSFNRHLMILDAMRPLLMSNKVQSFFWPILPPILPILTQLYR